MGLLEAIGGLLTGAAGDIKTLINGLWQGIKAVYSFTTTILDLVGDAWDWMVNGLAWLAENIISVVLTVYNLLLWIIEHGLPEAITYIYTKAVTWAKTAVKDAERALTSLIHAVGHDIRTLVADLKRYTLDAVKDVWRTLTTVWSWVEHEGKTAVNLVLHPALLVEHIVTGASEALLKWLLEQTVKLTVWGWKTTVSLLGEVAPVIEDALAKLI
jgi:phage-related protein